jgi:signal transduction histidine kinase
LVSAPTQSDIESLADAADATWHDIGIALTAVIGAAGVAALFQHSLLLRASEYPWLVNVSEPTLHREFDTLRGICCSRRRPTLLRQMARCCNLKIDGRLESNSGLLVGAPRRAMQAKLQHFEMRPPLSEVSVNGDSVRLSQVFSNLLDNASKYTGADGAIALGLAVSDEAVTVAVCDNGIAPEALPGIFDLFVQEMRGSSARNGGLGVRLTIARHLVEAHGGTLVGRSAGSDCGSEFVVTLPLADPHVASQVN